MRFWTIPTFGIDTLELREAELPEPGAGQVVVEVMACSLNFRDLLIVQGIYNPKLQLGRVPLSDGAGVVHAVGEGVTQLRPGDRVAGIFEQKWLDGPAAYDKLGHGLGGDVDGMATEYVVLPESGLVRIPDYLSFAEAATLPCAMLTAWNALQKAGELVPGATVLIQGTGGVSIGVLQLAKALGMRVLGTSSSDAKLGRAAALGLDSGVNYRQRSDWGEWAREQTGRLGVDLVIEVGGAGTFAQSVQAAKFAGSIAQVGRLTEGAEDAEPVSSLSILRKLLRVQGIYVGSRAEFEAMNRFLEEKQIHPVVDREFPFEQLPEALRAMEAGSHFGKVVLQVRR